MNLTHEQIAGLAPDSNSAAAGKKLATVTQWQELARNDQALWGLCKGSAVYRVRVDLSDLGCNCSCPSRKFPCKHALGLLMLAADTPGALQPADPPDWVAEWLAKRHAKAAAREARAAAEAPADPVAQARRSGKREARVREGVERLNLWLADLVRNGLAGLEAPPPRFWQEPAARLVDAQASGLAARVVRLGTIPGSSRDWPRVLLAELGRLKLLLHAYERIDALDERLQANVRHLIGWNVSLDELSTRAEQVADDWVVFGQTVDMEERLRVQRSWLAGRRTGRVALVLQFATGSAPFPEPIVPGASQEAVLAFYPGAWPQRARILERRGEPATVVEALPAAKTVRTFLDDVADALARQPWIERFGCVLAGVTLVSHEGRWHARDEAGDGLPLAGKEPWRMLALSGNHPFDLGGEWDGERLRPLGLIADNCYFSL
jgi:hypothetical protein